VTDPQTKGALTLGDYPSDVVRIACDRRGQYRRATLLTVFKETSTLPDILGALINCRRDHDASDPFAAYYSDLSDEQRRM
jgi:hypothetical protein